MSSKLSGLFLSSIMVGMLLMILALGESSSGLEKNVKQYLVGSNKTARSLATK